MTPPIEALAADTRERCEAALASDSLRAVAAIAINTDGLVDQVKHSGPLPPAWQALANRAEAEEIPDAGLSVARYLLLRKILSFSLDRMVSTPLPEDIRRLFYDEFRFVAEPERNSLDCLAPCSYALVAVCRETCLERFPAGQLYFEEDGFPGDWLKRVPRRELPRVAWHLWVTMGGRWPYYIPHNACRKKYSVLFMEKEQRRSMVRIARMLELNSHVRGFLGEGWLHSHNLGEASPHLKWMMEINRELVALGAVYTTLGLAPEDAGFLEGDRKRIAAYQSGQWKPVTGVIIVPRDTMIEWADQQKI